VTEDLLWTYANVSQDINLHITNAFTSDQVLELKQWDQLEFVWYLPFVFVLVQWEHHAYATLTAAGIPEPFFVETKQEL